jgi:hypothetical protein
LENAAVERIILKCNHRSVLGDLNDINYTNKERRFEKAKFNSRPNILHSKMGTLASNEHDTEPKCSKGPDNL